MAKAKTNGKAATTLAGDALAPRPGAAQPPLDLSLGHIGTRVKGEIASALEVEDFGAFRVVFDSETGKGAIYTDVTMFASRVERRAAERQFLKYFARNGGFALRRSSGGHDD